MFQVLRVAKQTRVECEDSVRIASLRAFKGNMPNKLHDKFDGVLGDNISLTYCNACAQCIVRARYLAVCLGAAENKMGPTAHLEGLLRRMSPLSCTR